MFDILFGDFSGTVLFYEVAFGIVLLMKPYTRVYFFSWKMLSITENN